MENDIKNLLEENLKLTKEIHKMTKYIRRYIIFSQIIGFLKLVLIIVPIILGIIYLPPLLKDVFAQYQELLNLKSGLNVGGVENIDPSKINPELLKMLTK